METVTSLSDKITRLVGSSREYLENKVELEVLKGADKIAQAMSLFIVIFMASTIVLVILLLLSFGFAVMINEAMNSTTAGYFIMAGAVLVLVIILLVLGRKAIRKKVIDMILNNIDND